VTKALNRRNPSEMKVHYPNLGVFGNVKVPKNFSKMGEAEDFIKSMAETISESERYAIDLLKQNNIPELTLFGDGALTFTT